jgi:ABC transport system ATP-binding/permease protein
MPNLINAQRITVSYGTRTLLNAVSLGVDGGDAIGVVGRNGVTVCVMPLRVSDP